jgi:SPP1 family predicted phage head-tail adaptor
MSAGRLRHRVMLQRRVDTQDELGQVVHSYVNLASVLAEIAPLTGRELVSAQQVAAEATSRIKIRHRADLDATVRVLHTVQHAAPVIVETYDVVSALPDAESGREWLILVAIKRIAEGWRRGN